MVDEREWVVDILVIEEVVEEAVVGGTVVVGCVAEVVTVGDDDVVEDDVVGACLKHPIIDRPVVIVGLDPSLNNVCLINYHFY